MRGLNSNSELRGKVFSIGHSNVTMEKLLLLLKLHDIDVLVDVRSRPYSKYAPQFNKVNLKCAVEGKEIKYGYAGKTLGGKPEADEFYDLQGHVIYSALAKSPQFIDGIHRLKEGIHKYRVALLCSEEDPKDCHRRLLIGRVLQEQGIDMEHIRANGRVQTDEMLGPAKTREEAQLPLLYDQEEANWRSVKPIRSASLNAEHQVSLTVSSRQESGDWLM